MNVIYTTRRSAHLAIERQPVNGFGVKLPNNFIVFHPYRDRWELARIPHVMVKNEYYESPRDLLDRVFGRG